MKFFIDTTNDFIALAIFNQNYVLVDYFLEKIVQKADVLPIKINDLLTKNNLKIQQINEFYLNLGPGKFTGCRIGLVFVRTICQLSEAKLFTTNSFSIISFPFKEKRYYTIKNSNNSSFGAWAQQGVLVSKMEIINENIDNQGSFDYVYLFKNFEQAQTIFKQEKKLLQVEALYLKDPKIN